MELDFTKEEVLIAHHRASVQGWGADTMAYELNLILAQKAQKLEKVFGPREWFTGPSDAEELTEVQWGRGEGWEFGKHKPTHSARLVCKEAL